MIFISNDSITAKNTVIYPFISPNNDQLEYIQNRKYPEIEITESIQRLNLSLESTSNLLGIPQLSLRNITP